MGYWHDTGWWPNIEVRINPGPDRKNDIKLALNEYRKNHNATHTFCVERRKFRDYHKGGHYFEDIIFGVPTPEYKAQLKAEEMESRRLEELTYFYKELFQEITEGDERYLGEWDLWPTTYKRVGERRVRKPRKAPGRGKADLSEEDLLQERLSKPRCRYQRGWKKIYSPTRCHYHSRKDLKNWKRYTKGCKSWDK